MGGASAAAARVYRIFASADSSACRAVSPVAVGADSIDKGGVQTFALKDYRRSLCRDNPLQGWTRQHDVVYF